MKYNKLVRDKIPEYIRTKGGNPISHVANEEEYWNKLKEKLFEEVEEFNNDENKEELADILEVLEAIIGYKQFDKNEIERIKAQKLETRGGFIERIILDES